MVTLKLLGFSDTEKVRFSSILTLAERGLKQAWGITDSTLADFFLIKEQLIPLMDQHEVLKKLPRQQCIFIRRKHDNLDIGGHQLYLGENEVPSLRLLVEFLNQIHDDSPVPSQANLAQSDSSQSNQPIQPPVATVESPFFDPEQGFLGYLLAPENSPRVFKLTNQDSNLTLYVDVEQNSYYSNTTLEQLKPYFFATDELQVEDLSRQQLQSVVANQALKARPLSHLLWFTAFTCSQGKIIKGYQKGDIVHLKRWPDINLPGCKQLIKLAAYMQSNAVDLDTVQAYTAIPFGQVYDFYNACKVIDLIGHSQTADIHKKHHDAEQKQLFARIGQRLNQAKQVNREVK